LAGVDGQETIASAWATLPFDDFTKPAAFSYPRTRKYEFYSGVFTSTQEQRMLLPILIGVAFLNV
jgi:hypothetical protein